MVEVTKIPNTPAYVEGIVNLRGKIIPIISLRRKLGFDEAERDKETRIMVGWTVRPSASSWIPCRRSCGYMMPG